MSRLPSAILIGVLLTGTASAQDGLRSPVLPEGGPAAQAGVERDLFRVPPDFYRRPPDPDASRLYVPYVVPTYGPAFFPAYGPAPYLYAPVPSDFYRRPKERPARRDAPDASPAPSVTLPPAAPGKPKTFYVIPGCYAGDRRPQPEWLPRGCDLSRLRIVPPA